MNNEGLSKISPLALAYIGDAVYELAVREYVLKSGAVKVGELHNRSVSFVRAERQAALVGQIEALLTEEEKAVLRRGRNAKGGQKPPHASVGAYRRATGLEALIGYLHLRQEQERLERIFAILFSEE